MWLFKILWRVHTRLRPKLLEVFSRPEIAGKVVVVKTLEDWQRLNEKGLAPQIHEKAAIGFDRAGQAYEAGRPDYPEEAVAHLIEKLGIKPDSRIAELGAGTGKFTRLIARHAKNIVAVEPVVGMREKLTGFEVSPGTAEATGLPSASVDVVIAAQAFHWFDGPAALREIHRILKPGGMLGLIWNVRDESVPWIAALTEIIDPYEGRAPRFKTMNWKIAFDCTQSFSQLELSEFSHLHPGTIETVVSRVASISFIAALEESERSRVLDRVRLLVRNSGLVETSIAMKYRTQVYWCRRLGI